MGNKATFEFSTKTRALEVVKDKNLEGKSYLVTGANTGIGYETVRALYNQGGKVWMACRNEEKMKNAVKKLEEQKPESGFGEIHTLDLDLSITESIKKCVEAFKENGVKLDVLINNAGLMGMSNARTVEGHTYMMGVNHFGTHLLTMLLLPLMSETGRVVVLSSIGHKLGNVFLKLDDLSMKRIGDEEKLTFVQSGGIYGATKLCNLLFAKELDRRLKLAGKKITSYSVHPGSVESEFGRYMNSGTYDERPYANIGSVQKGQ